MAFEYIDNAAHLGGLLAGAASGLFLARGGSRSLPIEPSRVARTAGILCMAIILSAAAMGLVMIISR